MYNNFYSNVCMFLGSLKRGICHKSPYVTFPVSKVGLDLAKIFRNLGVLHSFEFFQNTSKIGKNHYKSLSLDQEPDGTFEFSRAPKVYLKLNLNYEKFKPKYIPLDASPTDVTRSFFAHVPETVHVLSSKKKKAYATLTEICQQRRNYGPGIFLISSDSGLITDIDAERMNKGGIILGFIGLPTSYVVQIRGLLRKKYAEEAAQPLQRRVPLQQWSLPNAVKHELEARLAKPHIMALPAATAELQVEGGKPATELEEGGITKPASEQQQTLQHMLDKSLAVESQEVDSVFSRHKDLLEKQVVAWKRREVLRQLDDTLQPRSWSGSMGGARNLFAGNRQAGGRTEHDVGNRQDSRGDRGHGRRRRNDD